MAHEALGRDARRVRGKAPVRVGARRHVDAVQPADDFGRLGGVGEGARELDALRVRLRDLRGGRGAVGDAAGAVGVGAGGDGGEGAGVGLEAAVATHVAGVELLRGKGG